MRSDGADVEHATASAYLQRMPSLPRSDRRVPGGKSGLCIMCQRQGILRLGHVAARWLYTWVKDEGGGKIHGKYNSLGIPHAITLDGEKHYLLCDRCERHMNAAETYMRCVMVGSPEERRQQLGVAENNGFLFGLRFDLVQRFFLGTALRSHFATAGVFHNIHIPAHFLSSLRRALIESPASDEAFPIVGIRFTNSIPGVDTRALVVASFGQAADYAPTFRLIGGGWDWMVFFCDSGHGAKELFDLRLRADGVLPVMSQEFIENPQVRLMFELSPRPPPALD
jgi:hypothetical protein